MTTNFPSPSFRCDATNPALQSRFLRELLITSTDLEIGFLTLEDGSEWKLYLEGDALIRYVQCREQFENLRIPCLCSFQFWESENDFDYRVVCRRLAPRAVTRKGKQTWKLSGESINSTKE